jgi:hypothetical protein
MEVAVLGCGPAGLLVAHAVEQAGHSPHIFSKKAKSTIPGSQHLQGHIPGVTPEYPDSAVLFVRMGTQRGYAQKVYGDDQHPCGWPNYDGVHKSWSVFKAYDRMWRWYERAIVDEVITSRYMEVLADNYPIVLSTLPAPDFCINPQHDFASVPYWIQPRMTPAEDQHREVVVFNGLPGDFWYRWSILGRKESLESTAPLLDADNGLKAISNSCDCHPRVHRLGRWAKWQHGVLLHHAYQEALQLMEGANG